MPVYDYMCACGLAFEKILPMDRRDEAVTCEACGEEVERSVPETVAGVFNQTPDGPVPQNTGVSSFDLHVDRIIGASAEKGWAFQDGRDKEKREVLREHPEADTSDLSEAPDGEWEVMPPEVKQRTLRARLINSKAMESGRYRSDDLSGLLRPRRRRSDGEGR